VGEKHTRTRKEEGGLEYGGHGRVARWENRRALQTASCGHFFLLCRSGLKPLLNNGIHITHGLMA